MPSNEYSHASPVSGSWLTISSRKHGVYRTLVDTEMVPMLRQRRWRVSLKDFKKSGRIYFQSHITQPDGRRKTVSLHRFILGDPADMMVDHRDPDNTLDNRRCNLRVATYAQNARNCRKLRRTYSRYKGVAIDRKVGMLCVRIRTGDRNKHCGYFPDTHEGEIEAARTYDRAAIRYHGEFARTNFPRSDYARIAA